MKCPTTTISISTLIVVIYVAGLLRAQQDGLPEDQFNSPGLTDLDQATILRVEARSLAELERIIQLCESALDKELDEGSGDFAKLLLTATLYERAARFCEPILDQTTPDPRWPQLRTAAMSDLDKLLEFDDAMGAAHLKVAQLQALPGGLRDRALESANKAIQHLDESPELLSDAFVVRGDIGNEPEQQLSDYNEAVRIASKNTKALRHRAVLHLGHDRISEAMADFSRVLERDTEDAIALQGMGEALTRLKKFDDALNHLNQAIQVHPESFAGYMIRAEVLANQGDLHAAVDDLNSALRIQPRSVACLLARARLRQQLGDLALARSDLDRVLELNPDLPQAILLRSGSWAAAGRFDKAADDVLRILRLDPGNVDLQMQLAQWYSADQRPRKAINIYDSILAEDAENTVARRVRADALLSIGKQVEAIADYETILDRDPEATAVMNNLAWVLSTSHDGQLRDGVRAIQIATKACQITKYKQPHMLSTLASAYAEAGDFESAVKWSSMSVELDEGLLKEELQKELESFQNRRPWREQQEVEEKQDSESPRIDDLELD